jgi:tetratricopeptide (TPR) repeat protein
MKKSYEVGVVYNNRAAVWLTIAISENNDSIKKKTYLQKARMATDRAINLFKGWIDKFGNEPEDMIYKMVYGYYNHDSSIYKDLDIHKIIDKRVEDMLIAQLETPRRLSVAYTNLGTICRHSEDYESAMLNNKKALELWPDNLTAKNNINILLGRPLEERSTLDKLFPEDKDSE